MKSETPGNDIMKVHARGYTDEQLRQISALPVAAAQLIEQHN